MTTLTFRSPVTKPLLTYGTPKPVPPDPRAYDTFRVTQRFDSPDSYWAARDIAAGRPPRTHGATDIGNFRCGDPIVATAPGVARRVHDNATALGMPSDALGVVIDHGYGITTEYWHLNRQDVADGQRVMSGQQIGIVGSTGIGTVCHCHIEAKRNGVRFDPEPLLFGGSLTVEEDDVDIPKGGAYLVAGVVGAGNRLRVDPKTRDGSKVIGVDIGEPKAYSVRVYETGVPGEPYTLDGRDGSTYAWIGVFDRTWYVADPLVTDRRLTSQAPQPDVTAKLAGIRTAAVGAKQAIEAIEGLAR